MRKSIKLLVACMLCSPVAIVAQEQDSLFARKSKVAIEYGTRHFFQSERIDYGNCSSK